MSETSDRSFIIILSRVRFRNACVIWSCTTVHTYDEKYFDKIMSQLMGFQNLFIGYLKALIKAGNHIFLLHQ